ncbi:hypothetical protein MJ1_0374 [Nanobdella aerobiophila]|uniref:Uncharacterized protein n=1 Tax=Nanobdella aerobiophila TaxID=2586965 RepID=A0A915SCN2_9ARCH|nr:hypothetical protein [Nanobdella aerobiophila]BBL45538.1 hypothetical protein MJ1_0374 [Nanobdella aerobiophila]
MKSDSLKTILELSTKDYDIDNEDFINSIKTYYEELKDLMRVGEEIKIFGDIYNDYFRLIKELYKDNKSDKNNSINKIDRLLMDLNYIFNPDSIVSPVELDYDKEIFYLITKTTKKLRKTYNNIIDNYIYSLNQKIKTKERELDEILSKYIDVPSRVDMIESIKGTSRYIINSPLTKFIEILLNKNNKDEAINTLKSIYSSFNNINYSNLHDIKIDKNLDNIISSSSSISTIMRFFYLITLGILEFVDQKLIEYSNESYARFIKEKYGLDITLDKKSIVDQISESFLKAIFILPESQENIDRSSMYTKLDKRLLDRYYMDLEKLYNKIPELKNLPEYSNIENLIKDIISLEYFKNLVEEFNDRTFLSISLGYISSILDRNEEDKKKYIMGNIIGLIYKDLLTSGYLVDINKLSSEYSKKIMDSIKDIDSMYSTIINKEILIRSLNNYSKIIKSLYGYNVVVRNYITDAERNIIKEIIKEDE